MVTIDEGQRDVQIYRGEVNPLKNHSKNIEKEQKELQGKLTKQSDPLSLGSIWGILFDSVLTPVLLILLGCHIFLHLLIRLLTVVHLEMLPHPHLVFGFCCGWVVVFFIFTILCLALTLYLNFILIIVTFVQPFCLFVV